MNTYKDQRGLVSIIITIIIATMITLIIIGFANISRRELRQSLDNQLSMQALYAAESGINDARKALVSNPALSNTDYTTNCNGFIGAASLTPVLDASSTFEYTCLFVDPTPTSLEYDSVSTQKSMNIPVFTEASQVISAVSITWRGKNVKSTASCNSNISTLPSLSGWPCETGALRLDIALLESSRSLTRNELITYSSSTLFLLPDENSGIGVSDHGGDDTDYRNYNEPNEQYNPGSRDLRAYGQGAKLPINCSNDGDGDTDECTMIIDELDFSSYQATGLMLRLRSIYKDSSVTIQALDTSGDPIELEGTQAVVDATGRANDVLRRIQARVPLSDYDSISFPEFGLHSADSICKRFDVYEASPWINFHTTDSACNLLN